MKRSRNAARSKPLMLPWPRLAENEPSAVSRKLSQSRPGPLSISDAVALPAGTTRKDLASAAAAAVSMSLASSRISRLPPFALAVVAQPGLHGAAEDRRVGNVEGGEVALDLRGRGDVGEGEVAGRRLGGRKADVEIVFLGESHVDSAGRRIRARRERRECRQEGAQVELVEGQRAADSRHRLADRQVEHAGSRIAVERDLGIVEFQPLAVAGDLARQRDRAGGGAGRQVGARPFEHAPERRRAERQLAVEEGVLREIGGAARSCPRPVRPSRRSTSASCRRQTGSAARPTKRRSRSFRRARCRWPKARPRG